MEAAVAAFGAKVVAFLGGKLGFLAVPAILAVVYPFLKKRLSAAVSGGAAAFLEKALDPHTSDPTERKLIQEAVMSLVKLAEYKIPDRGMGKERYALAATWLVNLVPVLRGQEGRIAELIEEGVASMDEELRRRQQP